MDWFEEWFDSPLYEKLYADRDETEAHQLIELLTKTLSANHCRKILDLACGRGRHSIALAEKGYEVTGIDLSEQSIKKAKRIAADKDLTNIHFEVHDMRHALDKTFDAVVNLFTSFGYFKKDEENARIFDSIARMLKPNGILVFDYLNAKKVREDFEPADSGSFQEIEYDIKRYIENDAIHKDIVFKKGEKQKSYSERVKLYDLNWFEQQMEKQNLEIEKVFGDYEGNEFDEDKSPRLLIISRLKV